MQSAHPSSFGNRPGNASAQGFPYGGGRETPAEFPGPGSEKEAKMKRGHRLQGGILPGLHLPEQPPWPDLLLEGGQQGRPKTFGPLSRVPKLSPPPREEWRLLGDQDEMAKKAGRDQWRLLFAPRQIWSGVEVEVRKIQLPSRGGFRAAQPVPPPPR